MSKHIIAISENLLPAEWGGEKSLIRMLEDLTPQHDVSAIYRRQSPPSGPSPIKYLYRPDLTTEKLRALLLQARPDLLIVAYQYWSALADLPIRKLAYVCYWTRLVDSPPQLQTGQVKPLPGVVKDLDQYDGILASSAFCRSVLTGLGIDSGKIIVVIPICHLPEPQPKKRQLVLAVGQAKHRRDVLEAIKPVVLDYDMPRPTNKTDSIADYYDRADAVIHPTFLSESYCRVAVEAMHHGCPIVYTALGNLPELVGNTAGIGLPHDAPPELWVKAVEQVKGEQSRGTVGRQRARVIQEYHAARPAIRKAVSRAASGRKPWDIVLRIPRQYPGVATACDHLAAVHALRITDDRLPEQWDTLILGGSAKQWLDELPHLPGRVCLWWHSDLAQSGTTTNEIALLQWAMQAVRRGRLYAVLPTSRSLTTLLLSQGIRAHWLPNVIADVRPGATYALHEQPQVGLFSAAHPRKNHLTTLAACALTNSLVHTFPGVERHYRSVMDTLRVPRLVHAPQTKQQLYDLAAQLTCTPVVSHAETYCYQAAESILCGTPAIASPMVPVTQGLDSELSILPDPNDSTELAARIARLHRDPQLRDSLAHRQRLHLDEVNFLHKHASFHTLMEILYD